MTSQQGLSIQRTISSDPPQRGAHVHLELPSLMRPFSPLGRNRIRCGNREKRNGGCRKIGNSGRRLLLPPERPPTRNARWPTPRSAHSYGANRCARRRIGLRRPPRFLTRALRRILRRHRPSEASGPMKIPAYIPTYGETYRPARCTLFRVNMPRRRQAGRPKIERGDFARDISSELQRSPVAKIRTSNSI